MWPGKHVKTTVLYTYLSKIRFSEQENSRQPLLTLNINKFTNPNRNSKSIPYVSIIVYLYLNVAFKRYVVIFI